MARRLLNVTTVISLAVALLSGVALARARWSWRYEGLLYTRDGAGGQYRLISGPFNLAVNHTSPMPGDKVRPPHGWQRYSIPSNESDFDAGAAYIRASGGRARAGFILLLTRYSSGIAAPHWFVVGCASVLPVTWGRAGGSGDGRRQWDAAPRAVMTSARHPRGVRSAGVNPSANAD